MTTVDDPVSPAPTIRPLARHPQLETDQFCDCGYNLHGQVVSRDERLGFMVCRCPECGAFHPAGHGTAARSQWLSRLAVGMLIVWTMIVLGATSLLMLAAGVMQVTAVDEFSYPRSMTTESRLVEHVQQTAANPNVPATGYVLVYVDDQTPVPQPLATNLTRARVLDVSKNSQLGYYHNFRHTLFDRFLMGMVSAMIGLTIGVLGVIFLWHWRKRNYVWLTLVVLLPAIFVANVMLFDDEYQFIRGWALSRVAMVLGLQALFILLGVVIGRPVGRFVARVIIPPKPRQFLAFLWRADGKTPPMAKG